MSESDANPEAAYLYRCYDAGGELAEAAERIAATHQVAPLDALDAAHERLAPTVTAPQDDPDLFNQPGDVLRLVEREGCYAVLVAAGPSRERVLYLFGTDTIPLPYTRSAAPEEVLAHLRAHRPRATVLEGTR